MSANAAFASTPRFEVIEAVGPNTAFDGTGTITTFFTGGPNGSRIDGVIWGSQGSNLVGMIKFFFRASSEDSWSFLMGYALPATTVDIANGVLPYHSLVQWPLILEEGAQIGVAIHASETWTVITSMAGDF